MQGVQLAGKSQLLPLGRVQDGSSTFGWVTDCCFPGTAAQPGLQPKHYFQCSIKLWPYEAAGAYYDTILEVNLIWGHQLIFTVCKADWQDSAGKRRLNFQLLFHTHSLPPPPAIQFSVHQWLQQQDKLINKQLLFQTNFYYFNFMHREVSCIELTSCWNKNIPRNQECWWMWHSFGNSPGMCCGSAGDFPVSSLSQSSW